MASILLLHIRNKNYKHTYTFSVQECKFSYKKYEKTYNKGILTAKITKNEQKKGNFVISHVVPFVVEVTGFEPATFWSRTKRATKLRYTSLSWSQ